MTGQEQNNFIDIVYYQYNNNIIGMSENYILRHSMSYIYFK